MTCAKLVYLLWHQVKCSIYKKENCLAFTLYSAIFWKDQCDLVLAINQIEIVENVNNISQNFIFSEIKLTPNLVIECSQNS